MPAKEKKPAEKKPVEKKAQEKKPKAAQKAKEQPKAKAQAPAPTQKAQPEAKAQAPPKKQKQAPAKNAKQAAKDKPAAPKKKKLTQTQRLRLLAEPIKKCHGIGQSIPNSKRLNLTRCVKWPKYIVLQRQKRVLMKRLKMPPPLNQFNHTLDRNVALKLFKLLHKYRPLERPAQARARLAAAKAVAKAKAANRGVAKRRNLKIALKKLAGRKPVFVKSGLNFVTSLVEKGKAQLVLIAHDVDPIELVVWLPALCRKKKIPYAIVKGKSRLGLLVRRKTATAVAVTDVRVQDRAEFGQIVECCKSQFNDNTDMLREWRAPILSTKHNQKEAKRKALLAKAERESKQASAKTAKSVATAK
jgi:large subunit ribosomal protein L7Ae